MSFIVVGINFKDKKKYENAAIAQTKNIQKETDKNKETKNMDTNNKNILNISNLPITKYSDCIENGIYKISEREKFSRRKLTHVLSLSPTEILFINGYYHYSSNKNGIASAKQEKINQIEKYDITKDQYSKIFDLPNPKIRIDKIPFNENAILLLDGSTLYLYNILKNKLDILCDPFDYYLLFPYNKNEFLLVDKDNNLYILNIQTKKIKFLKKLTISLGYPLFKINDDLFINLNSNFKQIPNCIYSIKENKVYDELNDISEINTVEKISDNYLLIIGTVTLKSSSFTDITNITGDYKDTAYIYDIKNKQISKKIILREHGAFKQKYHLKKLSNNNFLLYHTGALLKIFNINNFEFQNLKHEYSLNLDGIEQIININDHQILINTQKNIYVYQY